MIKSRSGFTIVELLIVIVVIAILATIVMVAYSGLQARARDSTRDYDIKNLAKALELYYADNGQYPADPTADPCTNDQYAARSGCPSWTWLQQALQPYTTKSVPIDPINSLGSTTDPKQHSYTYKAMQYNNTWPLLCTGTWTKQFQAYYLISYKESGAINNQMFGTCSNANPFFGTVAGVYTNNYLVIR